MKDKEKTRVIFKMARYPGGEREVIAFFPGATANHGCVACYAHDGHHGEASYEFYAKDCRPCGKDSYDPLKRELEDCFGYRFEIVNRITKKDRENAWRRK